MASIDRASAGLAGAASSPQKLEPHKAAIFGVFAIAVTVVVTYFPALSIGFWMDDYIAIDAAGRITGLDYLIGFFDPRLQRLWYRPVIGMQWKLEYLLFRGDPVGYHLVQILIHLLNCLLLYWLVTRITRRWRVGLGTALLYAALPLTSMAIYWPSVHDPLAGVFYLLSLLSWISYLTSRSRLKWGLALVGFLGALLTKEVSMTLPVMLFLADRLLVNKPVTWLTLVKRYAVFAPILVVYGICQLIVVTRSEFTGQIGYSFGLQNTFVLLQFLSYLAFPWDAEQTVRYLALGGLSLLFLYVSLRRDRRLLFLGAAALLPVIIVAPIPLHLFNPRYLYLPLMATAVGMSLLLDALVRSIRRMQLASTAALGVFYVLVTFTGAVAITEQVTNFGGFIRQLRLQFRPIYQQHASLPPDTFMYFLDTPLQTLDISGLMYLRYGTNVSVGGVDRNQMTGLRDHAASYVYYLDEENGFREQPVAKNVAVETMPGLPARFEKSISLELIEIASAQLQAGEALALVMYWRTGEKISRDYTVFIHLVDGQQQIVAGLDRQPRRGLTPTSLWRVERIQPDGLALPIDSNIVPGTYNLEIGLYDLATMQRLAILGKDGQPATDRIVLGPIDIVE